MQPVELSFIIKHQYNHIVNPLFCLYKALEMETAAMVTIFLSCLLVSFTGYALYTAFGEPSKELRDPFEEHED
jgi:PsbN protein